MNNKLQKELRLYLIVLVLAYFGFAAFLYFTQRQYIYIPDTRRFSPNTVGLSGMSVIDVTTADGLNLSGWYQAPANPAKPVILMFHGNGGSIASVHFMSSQFLEKGYGLLLAEYRGYGGNPGTPSEQGLYLDARAYLAWLTAMKIPLSDIVLYGQSLGTAVAIETAFENTGFKAIVLESPFTSMLDMARKTYFYIPVSILLKDRYDSLAKVKSIRIPLFEFFGDKDMIVPNEQERKLFENANEPKTLEVISGATHIDLYNHGAGTKVIFFLDHLK